MKTIFDHKVFLVLGGVIDAIWLSVLWYLSCIPIFTVGASSAAIYYTIHSNVFEGRGTMFSTYKKAFKDNFKKGTAIWLIFLIMDVFLGFDLVLTRMAMRQGSALAALYYPVLVCIVMLLMWQISSLTYQARFDDTVKNVLAKGAVVAMTNIGWMLFLVLFLAGVIALCRYLIILVVLLPGGYAFLIHHVFEHIYRKLGWISDEMSAES